jgi:hypothetical protein
MRNSVEKQKMAGAAPNYFANFEWNNRTREKNKTRYFSDFFSFFWIFFGIHREERVARGDNSEWV